MSNKYLKMVQSISSVMEDKEAKIIYRDSGTCHL